MGKDFGIALARLSGARFVTTFNGAICEVGGSIAAEHGIGTTRAPYLGWTCSPSELALMRTIRRALDPKGILNPGKLFEVG